MLEFKCAECENTTAIILIDQEDNLLTECLACEHKELVPDWEDPHEGHKVFAMVADR